MVQLLWKTFCVSYKSKHAIMSWLSNCIIGHLSQGNKHPCSHKNLYRDICSNVPKIKTAQISSTRWMVKQQYTYTLASCSAIKNGTDCWSVDRHNSLDESKTQGHKWLACLQILHLSFSSEGTAILTSELPSKMSRNFFRVVSYVNARQGCPNGPRKVIMVSESLGQERQSRD